MASPRIKSYQHDDLTFDVIDEGPVDGDPVVLLHGFPQLATSWSAVAPLLHQQGLRTFALNQRGYSPGARPTRRRDYRMSELVGDVVALIEEIGGPVHVVGHDWGAAVAWSLAAEHPDLVRSLVSVSVPHPGAFIKAMPSGQILKSWYMAFFNFPKLAELALSDRKRAGGILARTGMTPAMVDDFWRDIVEGGALPGGLGWYRAIALSDPRDLRKKVKVPTTHVWSTGDDFLSRRSAELAGEWVTGADFGLEILDDASHWIPEEKPAELAEIINDRVHSVR